MKPVYFNNCKEDDTADFTPVNMFAEYPDIVTTAQLKEMLHLANTKMYELLNSGAIKSIRIGRTHKIPKASVIEFINKKIKESC